MQNDLAALSLLWIRSDHYIDLTSRQLATLAAICDRSVPPAPSELAVELGVQRPIVSRCLGVLFKHGLVERALRPEDRRLSIITPTIAGRQLRAQLASLVK